MFDFYLFMFCALLESKLGITNWNAKIETIHNPGNIYLIFQIFDSTEVYLER